MSNAQTDSLCDDAPLAALLLAIDPVGLGGVLLRSPAGPLRDRWLTLARAAFPANAPVRRMPNHIGEDRLLGGLDLTATLAAGRPVHQAGVLAETDGGLLVATMAERLPVGSAALVAAAMDRGAVHWQREGFAGSAPARFGVVALDEGTDADERCPAILADRLGLCVTLAETTPGSFAATDRLLIDVAGARAGLRRIQMPDRIVESLAAAAMALGVRSLRATIFAVAAARAHAALAGRREVSEADAVLAGRLTLAPRATVLPTAAEAPSEPAPAQPPPDGEAASNAAESGKLADTIVEAAKAAIPRGLLEGIAIAETARRARADERGAGAAGAASRRGRPVGNRRGSPAGGYRLDIVATLRAAAPWQRLRRGNRDENAADPERVQVRKDDLRIKRFKQQNGTTTIFAVDASGSSALHRLAEVKGAVELLLADCYVRRDRVAVVAFRGEAAEILLPPTRSLARAKRSLQAMAGGGGTPLASGVVSATGLADAAKRQGQSAVVVLLTDGRANIASDGRSDRPQAMKDALDAAQRLRISGHASLLIDTSPRPQKQSEEIAAAMGARYLPLPTADAGRLSQAVRSSIGA